MTRWRNPRRRPELAPAREPASARSGRAGEDWAARGLLATGARIVGRNVRTRHGEIDLLIRRGRTYAAVEVKARAAHPAPERLVTRAQLDRLERALQDLDATLRPRPSTLQIDVVAVRWQRAGPAAPPRDLLHFAQVRVVLRRDHAVGGPGRALAPGPDGPNKTPHGRAQGRPPEGRAGRRGTPLPLPLPLPILTTPMVSLAEQMIPRRKLVLLLAENLLFTAVMYFGTSAPPLASNSNFDMFAPTWGTVLGLLTCVTIAIICQASLSYNDLYDWRTAQNRAELVTRLVHSCGYSLVMLAVLVLVAPGLFYFPGLDDVSGDTWKLILLLGVAFALVYVLRHAFHWFFYKWRFGERVIIVGAADEAVRLGRLIQQNPMAGYELCGFVEEPGQPPIAAQPGDAPTVGKLDALRTLCRREGISRVVVALRERRGRVPVNELLDCRTDGVTIEEREAMYERLTGKLAVESMRPSYLIYGRGFTKDPLTMALKRVVDIVAATVGLVLSSPLCLLAALAVKLTSRGPIFFTQERVGQDGAPFNVIKFRTMTVDAEKESGPVWAKKNDVRVTRVGKFLRLARIDEIPQFINILNGHMSFVGPRPERPVFVEQLTEEIPFYPLRHTVKPGLTGWAQVQAEYGASVDDAREKLRYDLYYIKNMAPLFDLTIILKTVAVILRGKGAR